MVLLRLLAEILVGVQVHRQLGQLQIENRTGRAGRGKIGVPNILLLLYQGMFVGVTDMNMISGAHEKSRLETDDRPSFNRNDAGE